MISNTKPTNTPAITDFYKIKDTTNELKPLVEPIKDILPDSFVFFKEKGTPDRTLYILTGEHGDKFVENMSKIGKGQIEDFMDFKRYIEKIFNEKAKKLKLDKIKKQIEKGKLKL